MSLPLQSRCRTAEGARSSGRVPGHAETPRTYARMLSGRRLHLLDPSPFDIEIADLVTGISRVNRWCGQTTGPVGFNVAHHSVVVETVLVEMVWPKAPAETRLWALCHDLSEALLADIVTPVKAVIAPHGYQELEQRLDRAIRLRLGLPADGVAGADKVKRADRIVAVTEAVRLGGWSEADARRDVGGGYRGKLWEGPLEPWPEAEAREVWMRRFRRLGGAARALSRQ